MASHLPEDMGKFKLLFHRSHCKKNKAVTTTGKGGYTTAVQNIYSVPTPPLEEHNKVIDHINTIFQGIQMQSHELEGLSQANTVLASSNIAVMVQLAQINVTMNDMQAQLKTLSAAPMNQTRSKRI